MNKVILVCTLLIGLLAAGVQIRAHLQGAKILIASPHLPPPDCLPNCSSENN